MIPAQPVEDQAVRNVVVFHISDLCCAVDAEHVRQLIHLPAVIELAGQSSIVYGFLNVQGRAVPVVSGRRLFDLEKAEPDVHTPLLLMGLNGQEFALMADDIDDLVGLKPEDLQSVPAGESLNGCSEAQFRWQEEGVTLLSAERILTAKEQKAVADLAAAAQRRLSGIVADSG